MAMQKFLTFDVCPTICTTIAFVVGIILLYKLFQKYSKINTVLFITNLINISWIKILQGNGCYRYVTSFEIYQTTLEEGINHFNNDLQNIINICDVSYDYAISMIYIVLPVLNILYSIALLYISYKFSKNTTSEQMQYFLF